MPNANLKLLALGLVLAAACKGDTSGPAPKAGIVEVNPTTRSAPANTVISPDIVVKVQDASGQPMPGQTVQFAIALGGGSLTGTTTVTTDANGLATAPVWRLGKIANGNDGHILRVTSGSLDSLDIKATAASSYNITVRFFEDASMTAGQKALFTSAAHRIMGIITGDVAAVALSNQDISSCLKQTANTTVLTEQIDDLLIYATVKTMDGPGNVLASAGPCFVRVPSAGAAPSPTDYTPVIGSMTFDVADLGTLTGPGGSLQDVITHEMLHVVGLGSLWACSGSAACRGFIDNAGTSNPLYNAAQARAACVAVGGTVSCATKVPAEGCVGIPECAVDPNDPTYGAGTRDTHWRQSTFGTELMTGFLTGSSHPLSSVTIGGLVDLGYTVNTANNDTYTIAAGSIASSNLRAPGPVIPTLSKNWEKPHAVPLYGIDRDGNVRLLRKAR